MEMTSENIEHVLFICSIFITVGLMGRMVLNWIDRQIVTDSKDEPKVRDLSDPKIRADLTRFLQKRAVFGDADIRQGFVFPPVPPERLDPLAVVLGNAASFGARLVNPSSSTIFIRDSMSGQTFPLGDLDLDHIADAARVMQRVAEDRHKSRTLYKGLTDEEMRSMVRAGLSQWLKDEERFEDSNEVMQGLWDERPEFAAAFYVLDLFCKLKGSKHG